jgi:hypothetical protein
MLLRSQRNPVTADPGPAPPFNDMNASFMSFERHERGIHAIRPGAGEASVTEVGSGAHGRCRGVVILHPFGPIWF